ncbi:hypothetical protein PCASD_15831 [Puccinia coronata f. sp. avenae]|uniref:Cytochrome b5 heme-binding domain-containing protein n=1 Tax=Puccinia coronata f. sp. avenae TaxID=200324 RepID=A0A2N5T5X7_9BASI|nr:hypothetical protein PCASD_15831 [Puccinia coronata f. sp. avenae]
MFSFLGFPGVTTQSKPEEKPTATNTASASSAQILNSSSGQEVAPSFPAQNSIQRAASSSQRTKRTTPASPSSHPTFTFQSPDDDEEDGYNEDEEEANLVMEELNNVDLDTLLELPHSTMQKPKKPRKKVHLLPGFSQLDWARLKASGANLRGESVTSIRRITRAELAAHKSKEDAWSSFNGKVYNITSYLNYHPGGIKELMRVAGKDGTELFMKTHAWISIDGMLDACLVGFLVND